MKRIILTVLALALLTTAPARAAAVTTATEANNGAQITVHVGDTVQVVLKSAAWTINDGDGTVMKPKAAQQDTPGRPGPGCCGSATRLFVAAAAGTGSLTADRTTCGEALKCSPAQSHYRVSVKVLGAPSTLPFTGFSFPRTVLLGLLLLGIGVPILRSGLRRA